MPKRPIRPDDLLRFVFVGDPQMSPDGTRVLFTRKHTDEKNKTITQLYTVDLAGGEPRQWTRAEGGAGAGRWSPDGKQIAFISGRDKPGSQIYLMPTDGGEARKLTSLDEGSIGEILWSPDSAKIAFTYRATHPEWTEQAKKDREASGGSIPPRVIESAWYRLDGDGYFDNQRYAVYVIEVASGVVRELCRETALGFYSLAWSPDSQELAIAHTVNKNPWADAPNDQIFRVSVEDGQAWQLEGLPKGDKGNVKWSPDGKSIAYMGDHSEDDPWGVRNVKAYVVPAEGGSWRCLTDGTDFCLATATLSDTREAGYGGSLEWSADSKSLYVEVVWHGESQLGRVDVEKGGVELLTGGRHVLGIGGFSADRRKVGITYGHPTRLPEVAWVDLDDLGRGSQPLTKFNQAFHEEVKLSEPEELWLESLDGAKVHAWAMKPIDFLEPKRYPAVLEIHGGPHTQYGWAFFHEFQVLAAAGYVVVYSNPRGSKGYGEAHCAAIRGAWGDRDWEDIQTVTRWMQHQPYIHPGQMGVMGGSYGGYMTNWVVGHTRDFRAAITDRCVSNLVSMGGNSDFPINRDGYWKGYFFGDIDAIEEFWKQSPIAYFDQVETPMLIIHSEGDLRCNVEQSEQVFAALQIRGIESRFVRYPVTTSHGMSRSGPADLRLHRLGEIVRWWDKHLK